MRQPIWWEIKGDLMLSLPHQVTKALSTTANHLQQGQCRLQGSVQVNFRAILLTSTPWAAEPGRPAFQTSSGAVDARSGPHLPEQHCIFAEVVRGAQLHTWLAGFSLCAPEIAGCWPLPAGDPAHAEKENSTRLDKVQTEEENKRKALCIIIEKKLPLAKNTENHLYLNICACTCAFLGCVCMSVWRNTLYKKG